MKDLFEPGSTTLGKDTQLTVVMMSYWRSKQTEMLPVLDRAIGEEIISDDEIRHCMANARNANRFLGVILGSLLLKQNLYQRHVASQLWYCMNYRDTTSTP